MGKCPIRIIAGTVVETMRLAYNTLREIKNGANIARDQRLKLNNAIGGCGSFSSGYKYDGKDTGGLLGRSRANSDYILKDARDHNPLKNDCKEVFKLVDRDIRDYPSRQSPAVSMLQMNRNAITPSQQRRDILPQKQFADPRSSGSFGFRRGEAPIDPRFTSWLIIDELLRDYKEAFKQRKWRQEELRMKNRKYGLFHDISKELSGFLENLLECIKEREKIKIVTDVVVLIIPDKSNETDLVLYVGQIVDLLNEIARSFISKSIRFAMDKLDGRKRIYKKIIEYEGLGIPFCFIIRATEMLNKNALLMRIEGNKVKNIAKDGSNIDDLCETIELKDYMS